MDGVLGAAAWQDADGDSHLNGLGGGVSNASKHKTSNAQKHRLKLCHVRDGTRLTEIYSPDSLVSPSYRAQGG
jgi:hypothetical protein